MRISILLMLIPLVSIGCTSPEKSGDPETRYPDLVRVEPPEDGQQQEESQLYIDTVEKVSHAGDETLLIKGSFPDGCTRLKNATHSRDGDTLKLAIRAWRELDIMCSQALTSFSFLYTDIPEQTLNNSPSVIVNDKTYQIQ